MKIELIDFVQMICGIRKNNNYCRPSQSRRKRDTAAEWRDTTLGVRNMALPQLVESSEFGDPDYQTTPHRYTSYHTHFKGPTFVGTVVALLPC
jgi:hypothetical protein